MSLTTTELSSTHSFPIRKDSYSPFNIPSPVRQAIFFLSGTLAGCTALPTSFLYSPTSSQPRPAFSSYLRANAAPTLLRTGIRFWVFDLVRLNLPASWFDDANPPPAWQVGAIGGAYGGAMEVLVANAIWRPKNIPRMENSKVKLPIVRQGLEWLGATTRPASIQGLRLFMCFGTYNYLTHKEGHNEQPLRHFWRNWGMAMIAGALGETAVGMVEQKVNKQVMLKKPTDWIRAGIRHAGRGATIIGTVIAIQTTSSTAALRWMGE